MAIPSPKSPTMEKTLERMFGRTTAISRNVCSFCKGPAISFRDELSAKEYTISSLCQACQDKVFGGI